jgi:hypothetical protein
MADKLDILFAIAFVMAVFSITWIMLAERQRSLYDREDYNCEHMTMDLKIFFESLGFDVDKVIGHRYDIPGDVKTVQPHCWLRINLSFCSLDFESTTLRICDNSNKYFVSSIK